LEGAVWQGARRGERAEGAEGGREEKGCKEVLKSV